MTCPTCSKEIKTLGALASHCKAHARKHEPSMYGFNHLEGGENRRVLAEAHEMALAADAAR